MEIFQKLTQKKNNKEKLINLSFALQKKKKNTEILKKFELQVISEYFSDYMENV